VYYYKVTGRYELLTVAAYTLTLLPKRFTWQGHFGEEGNFKKNSLYKATMTACQPRLIH